MAASYISGRLESISLTRAAKFSLLENLYLKDIMA